jgi:hypothetical protein
MAEKTNDYQDKYTKVHMKREVHEVAKKMAKAQNRKVANYIEYLVYEDAARAEAEEAREAAQVANIPGSKVK